MTAPLAAVTMVYNEPEFLPYWTRHYTRQLEARHCYVIDHGSDDALIEAWRSAGGRDVNLVRIPRSPQDDTRRTAFLSEFCASLLRWYGAVLYSDSDELVVADPARYRSLTDYAANPGRGEPDVATADGLDVIHTAGEAAFDWQRDVSAQRRWTRFSSAMCKPVLIRRPVRWAPGFHCTEEAPSFGALTLFHLRYADEESGVHRLARTRAQPWADPQAGSHQRMADQDWLGMLRGMAGLDRVEDAAQAQAQREAWRARVVASAESRRYDQYKLDLHLSGDRLWPLTERLTGLL